MIDDERAARLATIRERWSQDPRGLDWAEMGGLAWDDVEWLLQDIAALERKYQHPDAAADMLRMLVRVGGRLADVVETFEEMLIDYHEA